MGTAASRPHLTGLGCCGPRSDSSPGRDVERRSDTGDRRVVRLFVTGKGRQVCEDYHALADPYWRDAFDFVDPADEPVIRKFLVDMIGQFSELIRKERGR